MVKYESCLWDPPRVITMSEQADSWTFKRGKDLLEKASKALETPLCDHCLGRLFARSGWGLTNQERGKSLRITLALVAENPVEDDLTPEQSIAKRLPIHPVNNNEKRETGSSGEEENSSSWNVTDSPTLENPWKDQKSSDDICFICENIFERIEPLVSLVEKEAEVYDFKTFQMGTSLDPSMVQREERIITKVEPRCAEPLKEEINREMGKILQKRWPDTEVDRSDPDITFIIQPIYDKVESQVKPLFVRGRYRKLKRGIPQTRWPCRSCHGKGCEECNHTGRRYLTSVEEEIGEVFKKHARGDDYKLHGMGREDVDVRMLGGGRPFIMEISRPKIRDMNLDSISREINDDGTSPVEIEELSRAQRKEIGPLKESKKRKRYRTKVNFSEPIDEKRLKYGISHLTRGPIRQRTPVRVSHRRADKIRKRVVHDAGYKLVGDRSAEIEILADGGLYIKELLHGDQGRTEPSLASSIDMKVEVEYLDVTDVLDG